MKMFLSFEIKKNKQKKPTSLVLYCLKCWQYKNLDAFNEPNRVMQVFGELHNNSL